MPSQSERQITFGDWTTGAVSALCDDDRCPWKHRASLQAVNEASAAHARESGHSVTVRMESLRTIG